MFIYVYIYLYIYIYILIYKIFSRDYQLIHIDFDETYTIENIIKMKNNNDNFIGNRQC